MKIDKLDYLQIVFVADAIREMASAGTSDIISPVDALKKIEAGSLLLLKLLVEANENIVNY